MIDIVIKKDGNCILSCTIKGHAEYDEHGYDIVCAAISAISCTTILGLQEVALDDGIFENKSGYCLIAPQKVKDSLVQALMTTMVLGFSEISRQYSSFVKVSEK